MNHSMYAPPPLPIIPNVQVRFIPGYKGYAVTDTGRVFSCRKWGWICPNCGPAFLPTWREMTPTDSYGYMQVKIGLDGKTIKRYDTKHVHVLVMLTFVGPRPSGYEVCHNNGKRADNRLSNLRYDTPRGNCEDRERHKIERKRAY